MQYIARVVEPEIEHALGRGRSVFLFGAQQTGKTTMVNRLNPQLAISLVQMDVRQRYEKSSALLRGEVEALQPASSGNLPLVVLDEVQKMPAILDVVLPRSSQGQD